jgi:hypothetical protein
MSAHLRILASQIDDAIGCTKSCVIDLRFAEVSFRLSSARQRFAGAARQITALYGDAGALIVLDKQPTC